MSEFSERFESWGRAKGIPLRDILQYKEDIAICAMHERSNGGEEAVERQLFAQFNMFTMMFGAKLPPGAKSLVSQRRDSSDE